MLHTEIKFCKSLAANSKLFTILTDNFRIHRKQDVPAISSRNTGKEDKNTVFFPARKSIVSINTNVRIYYKMRN